MNLIKAIQNLQTFSYIEQTANYKLYSLIVLMFLLDALFNILKVVDKRMY